MEGVIIKNYSKKYFSLVQEMQHEFAICSGTESEYPVETYSRPGFERGKNIFCAFDRKYKLLGTASILPQLAPEGYIGTHILWLELKVDSKNPYSLEIKDALMERVFKRAEEIKNILPVGMVQLTTMYYSTDNETADYFTSKKFYKGDNGCQMRRDLSITVPDFTLCEGAFVREWKMESDSEIEKYLYANSKAFPEEPLDFNDFKTFLKSDLWKSGTTFTAFDDEDNIVGSLIAYWNDELNLKNKTKNSYMQSIFVLPAWRRKGIARYMISEGLRYFKKNGLEISSLSVSSTNFPAMSLYRSLGYEVVSEKYHLIYDV